MYFLTFCQAAFAHDMPTLGHEVFGFLAPANACIAVQRVHEQPKAGAGRRHGRMKTRIEKTPLLTSNDGDRSINYDFVYSGLSLWDEGGHGSGSGSSLSSRVST